MPDETNPSSIVRIAVLESQIEGLKDNIILQAKEYERRLSELNHAHQIQMDRNANYVSRELWEAKLAEMDQWRRGIDRWMWLAVGAGMASGGAAAWLVRFLSR